MRRFLIALLVALTVATPAYADRIKDLGGFQGIRSNQLTGYGIVVGLPGTGDDNLEYTIQPINPAQRSGASDTSLPDSPSGKAKRASAITEVANPPSRVYPVNCGASHRFSRCSRQYRHTPQVWPSQGMPTRSPISKSATPAPIASTRPTIS